MKNKISLVKFFKIVFRQAPGKSEKKSQNQTPIVNKYKGILKNNEVDEKTELTDIIIKKHS